MVLCDFDMKALKDGRFQYTCKSCGRIRFTEHGLKYRVVCRNSARIRAANAGKVPASDPPKKPCGCL